MLGKYLDEVRKKTPLVHNITNYVTVNDVANILLACGGSPIMSDEPRDVEDITSICGGLNINIGTLNKRSIKGMKIAGRKAQELGHVTLLDPVGAGASTLRTETAAQLMEMIRFTVIRGNISEIKALALGSGTTKGVDADIADAVTEDNLDDAVRKILPPVFAEGFLHAHGEAVEGDVEDAPFAFEIGGEPADHGMLFDEQDLVAGLGQSVGRRQAAEPAAGYDDVNVVVHLLHVMRFQKTPI